MAIYGGYMSELGDKLYAKFGTVGSRILREALVADLSPSELSGFANAVREAKKEGKLRNDMVYNPDDGTVTHYILKVG